MKFITKCRPFAHKIQEIFLVVAAISLFIYGFVEIWKAAHSYNLDPLLWAMFLWIAAFSLLCKLNEVSTSRPRIHKCVLNGLLMVAADADVELAIQTRERTKRYHLDFRSGEFSQRIKPAMYALFSDDFRHWSKDGVLVYPMQHFRELERYCIVICTEMDVPNLEKEGVCIRHKAVSIRTLWRLITNHCDVELPAELALA